MRASLTRSAHQPAKRSLRSKAMLSLLLALPSSRHQTPGVQGHRSRQSEQGLSIIECLVAIVVIAITVVAITPPIMLATASRIQSRKVEKANQVAQGEIDRVKLLVERGTYKIDDLPAELASNTTDIGSAGVATTVSGNLFYILSKQTGQTCANSYPGATPMPISDLVPVDVDGDCKADYVMQAFRTTGKPYPSGATEPFSFVMGVRVYAYYPGQPFTSLDKTKASLRMGTGPLDVAGGKRRPMAVLYSAMARNDSSKSLGQLCSQQKNADCKF